MSAPEHEHRVGYVLKMYPRFSETFIVTEILALEALGTPVRIFSLRPPVDGHFHKDLARVAAPVSYLPHHVRSTQLWATLREATGELPDLARHLPELLAADPDEAAAAVSIALSVRRERLTHLHAHFGSVATGVARLAALLAGVPYTFTAHAKDIFHEEVDQQALSTRIADAAAVVTVSDFNIDHLRGGVAAATPERLVRIHNGLDLERFTFHDPQHRPAGPPSICAVGRLVEKKGFGDLVDAVALLRSSLPDLRLDLVGSGPEEQRLRERVTRRGLDDVVTFHGPLPQDRVRQMLRAASVFAAPCVVGADGNRDGLPTVLLEALATGTPCVATPVTGIPEAVVHGETGLLVPESDPSALATALDRLLADPVLAARLAAAGRALVEERFDVRRNVQALDRLQRSAGRARPAAERRLVGVAG